ncbi:MAG: zinc-binding dehydrogenase [Trueperaceae bacterium]
MKAWQFTGTNQPLALNDVPEPTAGPGQVVLDIKAAGLCHSDVGVLDDPGWMALIAKTPITIGHENAGVISELGEGVTGFKVGDRVAVCPTTPAGAPGYNFDGGFAPKMVIDAQALVPIPDGVDFLAGAAATDAGMTSYAAVVSQGGVKKGDKVGIIGFGGLGQIGTRVAVLKGAEVYVAELNESVWHLAKEAGVAGVAKSLTDFPDVKFDVIVDFAGFGTTTAQAVDIIRRDGTVVLVGMGKLESLINTRSLILNQCNLKGSNGGTKEDIAGVYELMASGDLKPTITAITFDEIPEGIDKLRDGKVTGRLVAAF